MPSIYNIRFFLSLFKLKQQQNYRPSMFGFLQSEVFRAYLTESDTSYGIHSLCYYISLKITITLTKKCIMHLIKPSVPGSLAILQ